MWKKIEGKTFEYGKVIVVKAFNINFGNVYNYTSDPYCVWMNSAGVLVRWPHPFDPTHYLELPDERE